MRAVHAVFEAGFTAVRAFGADGFEDSKTAEDKGDARAADVRQSGDIIIVGENFDAHNAPYDEENNQRNNKNPNGDLFHTDYPFLLAG